MALVAYTKTIIATKGRASYLYDRSIAHQDAGATSSYLILNTIFEESLTDEMQKNVKVLDIALVEGAITIAVDNSIGRGLHQIEEAVKKLCLHKMS
ncbi:DAK2 domain-containing protein [Clostridium estertheticum]|uniref:DAK2 domain-containing protein n=1 Tax=Clostridium estertheticum TaxID=238834 RepID=UPI001CF33259|nr:DAK2 domain-containing protein [Clostridium estertheticum]MCB2353435.1 DAK2 domain-containing protein [Clostridium estertheticum]WAG43390.1 DAK2 domain-containing protein [Clostridium estertheticum]